jgi:RimJ/RimL family protein N-acetyltransferase
MIFCIDVNMLTQHAFSMLDAKRIEIRCDPENTKSAAIPKRFSGLRLLSEDCCYHKFFSWIKM